MVRHHRYSQLLPAANIIIDGLLLNLSFLSAYYLKFGIEKDIIIDQSYLGFFIVFNALWFAFSITKYPYERSRISYNLSSQLLKFLQVVALHAGFTAILWVFMKGGNFSRLHLALSYVIFIAFGGAWRVALLIFLKRYRATGWNIRNYVIAGYGEITPIIVHYFNSYPEMGYHFKGYFDTNSVKRADGDFSDLKIMIAQYEVDTVYCCVPYLHEDDLRDVIEFAQNHSCDVKLFFDYRSFVNKEVSVEYHDFLPIINVSDKPFSDIRVYLLKRSFDLAFSLTALLLLSPLLLLISLLTKYSSSGPVFFKQKRIGQFGKSFTIYKFRSMYFNLEEVPIPSQGSEDPRVTPWGRFMRKTRLDELPQFFNVLRGDMSIVGPRPLTFFDAEGIMEVAPEYRFLLSLRPGITSFGQVNYGHARNVEESVERLNFDLVYLKKNSFSDDIRIIFKTLSVMVGGKGR